MYSFSFRVFSLCALVANSRKQEMSTFGKFLKGVLQFRKSVRAPMVKKIQEVTAHGHASAVMYACMDARIKPLRSSLRLESSLLQI